MKTMVISLGGSVMIPDKIDYDFLERFKQELRGNYRRMRFVVVCGGGSVARKYISALEKEGKSKRDLSEAGIRATRMNALFLMQFFGKEANDSLPVDMKEVKANLRKNKIVICGALRFEPDSTSDGTSAKLAHFLGCDFINVTNVPGLFTSDPKKHKNALLIPEISWKDFNSIAQKIKFHAGQHFVLDQKAAKMIKKHKITTYIISNPRDITNILNGKKFGGTIIQG